MDHRYAAGLFDGEGWIRIGRQRIGNHTRYQLFVGVNMTTPRPLLELRAEFGGSFHIGKPRNADHKTLYGWTIGDDPAAAFLRVVRPELRVKDAEADVAIEYRRRFAERDWAHRALCYQKLLVLKTRHFDPLGNEIAANSGNPRSGNPEPSRDAA